MSNILDQLLQLMQLIQYCHVLSVSTIITNRFIGEECCICQTSINGYEAMGFDATQFTQDEEQRLFAIKTSMPIPMLVYGDSFQWAKYGHHILPSSLDLTIHNNVGLYQKIWNTLIEFLSTILDGNLSYALNPFTATRLDHYLSSLQKGLSETANKGKFFDQHLLNEQSKEHFIAELARIALFATQISLSIFTNLFQQRFEKHFML
jgi:hypothetical protein